MTREEKIALARKSLWAMGKTDKEIEQTVVENDDFAINVFMELYRDKKQAIKEGNFEEAVEFKNLCSELKKSHPFLHYVWLGLFLGENDNMIMSNGKPIIFFNSKEK